MNQPLLLHVVERLESFAGKLPATIQKPILNELTPLKELFLRQRPPRFVFSGSNKNSLKELLGAIFPPVTAPSAEEVPMQVYRWQDVNFADAGTISVLDARGTDEAAAAQVQEELKRQPADIIFFVDDGENARGLRKSDLDNFRDCLAWSDKAGTLAKVIGLTSFSTKRPANDQTDARAGRFQAAFASKPDARDRLLHLFVLGSGQGPTDEMQRLMSTLTRELPNEGRIEMIRISRDRGSQEEVAQVLVKSTTAICTAIGAQPIPLADLPILTTLQLVMVSGIMYLSGRERSLRAATEFVGALGANVGVGMLLREGTRALLKFFPGWGNVVCGMVAGAGTYAIGRAAIVFFIEGVSLKDARRTYLTSRKRRQRPALRDSGAPKGNRLRPK